VPLLTRTPAASNISHPSFAHKLAALIRIENRRDRLTALRKASTQKRPSNVFYNFRANDTAAALAAIFTVVLRPPLTRSGKTHLSELTGAFARPD
jgi:hypothetical protein